MCVVLCCAVQRLCGGLRAVPQARRVVLKNFCSEVLERCRDPGFIEEVGPGCLPCPPAVPPHRTAAHLALLTTHILLLSAAVCCVLLLAVWQVRGKAHSVALVQLRLKATGQSVVVVCAVPPTVCLSPLLSLCFCTLSRLHPSMHHRQLRVLNSLCSLLGCAVLWLCGCCWQGNTHLFWDPSRPHVKAVQTHAALSALRAFSRQLDPPSQVRTGQDRARHAFCSALVLCCALSPVSCYVVSGHLCSATFNFV